MAKIAASQLKLPEFKLPKVDLDALFGLQKANLAVAYEAQTVLLDAAQAIVRLQHGYAQDLVSAAQAAFRTGEPKRPEAVLTDMKAVAEKAVAVAKEGMDLGVAAQQRVVGLVTQQVQANVDELKSLAA